MEALKRDVFDFRNHPALNEERYIGDTLQKLALSTAALKSEHDDATVQIILVDNDSTDRTAEIARSFGATVIEEPVRNIARARNAGAKAAESDLLFFLDADTSVPPSILTRILSVMKEPTTAGGAVDVYHSPSSTIVKLYLYCYHIFARLCRMAQGAAQFYRRDIFEDVGGYDEKIFMGEDVDFYWRTARAAKKMGKKLHYISDIQVAASPRRYDNWPLWKILLWTNPLVISLLCRFQSVWQGWYKDLPR